MQPLTTKALATDLARIRQLFADFFAGCSTQDWQRPTELAGAGWTLRETVAHLDAVSQAYRQTIEAALAGEAGIFPGMARSDLPAWNRRQIETRAHRPIRSVCDSFLATLAEAETLAATLSLVEFSYTALLPAYNRSMSVAELLSAQAVHPGLVHAAQLANGAGVEPLWIHYDPELIYRQVSRLFNLISFTYWPERGGSRHSTVNFVALGASGGSWHVTMAPSGGNAGLGKSSAPTLTVWFRNIDTLCRFFTFQVSLVRMLLTGQSFAWGNLPLGFRLIYLFKPT